MDDLMPGERVCVLPNQEDNFVEFTAVVVGEGIYTSHSRQFYRVGRDADGVIQRVSDTRIKTGTLKSIGKCTQEELLTHKCLEVRRLVTVSL